MNKEIEIKVIVKNPEETEKNILRIPNYLRTAEQTDKYFVPKNNDFFKEKLTKEFLRIRHDGKNSHLNYSYCHYDDEGHFLSTDEYESIIKNPADVEELLKKIGMVYKVTVKKLRKYFIYNDFEITLDNIEGLGYFIEIEAKKYFESPEKTIDECYNILNRLNINYEKCPELGYPDMILRKNE